jgi:hypothetical protein
MTCRPLTRRLWIQKLLRYGVKLFVFYGFDLKPRVIFIRSSTCKKKLRTRSSVVLSLFRARYGYTKKEPPMELTLSPFHDSLNMKRLPSDLAIFTLVKVFEFTHPPSDSLPLFRSHWIIVRKRH